MSATTFPATGMLGGAQATGMRTAPMLDRVTRFLLLASVGTVQVSLPVSEIFLAATLLCWAAQLVRDRERPQVPAFFWPILAFAVTSLISVAFSADLVTSWQPTKKLLLFLTVPLIYREARRIGPTLIVDVILSVGAANAAVGIVQYGVLEYDFLGQRPTGVLGHYMTYSGLLMLVVCAAVARLVFGWRNRTWAALLMPALFVALVVTFTRSAWVGACVGVSLLFMMKDFRLVAVLPVLVAGVFTLAPDSLAQRMMSTFDIKDPTNRDRVAMFEIGTAIIRDHPLTGVGPNMIERVYAQYRRSDAVQAVNVHLHNVPLQLAAERGMLTLAAWLWMVVSLVAGLVRLFRAQSDKLLPATGLAVVAAMLSAGMFEHNFGDSEFLLLFLVLVTLPFAAARTDRLTRA